MTLKAETRIRRATRCAIELAGTLRAVTKLGGNVELVGAGSLPNDGKVIADERDYREIISNLSTSDGKRLRSYTFTPDSKNSLQGILSAVSGNLLAFNRETAARRKVRVQIARTENSSKIILLARIMRGRRWSCNLS